MTDKKRKADSSPTAQPPPEADASERLLQAEGTDVAQRSVRGRRRRRTRAGRTEPPVEGPRRLSRADQSAAPPPASAPANRANVGARIRELEERLDRMIVAQSQWRDSVDNQEAARSVAVAEPRSTPPLSPSTPEGAFDTARELLSTDFYLRQWGRLGLRNRSEEVDEFGYDPVYEQKLSPLFNFFYDKYFRVETHGIERVPSEGRCLLVANHSGTLPVDGMMLRLAIRRAHPQRRELRWLAEDAIFHFPFVGTFTNRLGAVRACQENAERLLDQGALVAVFPEGMKGISKLFTHRYSLQRFGRGGFVKLALRTRTPVVPVAVIGGEETNPMIARIEYLASVFGVPYLPVTPTFPLLGPLGLLPAPTKWKIYFGEPIDFDTYGAESTEDEVLVGRLTERVRAQIQSMLDRGLAERRSVWFG